MVNILWLLNPDLFFTGRSLWTRIKNPTSKSNNFKILSWWHLVAFQHSGLLAPVLFSIPKISSCRYFIQWQHSFAILTTALCCYWLKADLPCCAVVRVIEQCCFNSVPDPFKGQTINFILKPPKVIESRIYVKKANLQHYWNNTVLLLWQQH